MRKKERDIRVVVTSGFYKPTPEPMGKGAPVQYA